MKPECPLCKAKFQSIIHTIESDEDYQSYQLPPRPPSVPMPAIIPLDPVPFDQRFRYRPGMPTVMRARHQHQLDMAGAMAPFILPSRPPPAQSLQLPSLSLPGTSTVFSHGPMWHRRRGRATSEFRHDVYERNLYVDGGSVVDVTGRFRECSPEWFRNNEASTHRLVPWLNREMNVLLLSAMHQAPFVIQLILDALQRHDIRGPEFMELLQPYLGLRTEHFQHEFYHFARSVYDMVGFDRHSNYALRQPDQRVQQQQQRAAEEEPVTMVISSSSSDEDDDIVVLDEIPNSGSGRPRNPPPAASALTRRSDLTDLTERIRQRLESNGGFLGPRFAGSSFFSNVGPPAAAAAMTSTSTPDRVPTPPLLPSFDGPSTSSGEASSNFNRLVIPEDDSSDLSNDDDTIEVVSVVRGSTPQMRLEQPPQRMGSPEVVHLSSDEEMTAVPYMAQIVEPVSPAASSEDADREEGESTSEAKVERRRSRQHRQRRRQIENKRRAALRNDSSESTGSRDSISDRSMAKLEEGEDDNCEYVPVAATPRRKRKTRKRASSHKASNNCNSESEREMNKKSKGKGKGKGKKSSPAAENVRKREEVNSSDEAASTDEDVDIEDQMSRMNSRLESEEDDDAANMYPEVNHDSPHSDDDIEPPRSTECVSVSSSPIARPSRPKRKLSTDSSSDDIPLSKRFHKQQPVSSPPSHNGTTKRKILLPVAAKKEEERPDNPEAKGDLRNYLMMKKRKEEVKEEELDDVLPPPPALMMAMRSDVVNVKQESDDDSEEAFRKFRQKIVMKKAMKKCLVAKKED